MFTLTSAVFLILTATLLGWALWQLPLPLALGKYRLHSVEFIDKQIKYQLLFLGVALLVSLMVSFSSQNNSSQIFAIGNIGTGAKLGLNLLVVFGGSTMLLAFPSWRHVFQAIHCFSRYAVSIVPLAAVNALSEELIYRGALVNGALNYLVPCQIAALSALLFSVAHIRGQASGWFVIAGSAVVGWFLAISVLQSHGLFWAWCIHFFQDIVIFTAFVASAVSATLKQDVQKRAL